jgi:hypothetical protein
MAVLVATGTYTGTGSALSITGLGLGGAPDVVFVKSAGAIEGRYRTSTLVGDLTFPLGNALPIAGQITSLDSDGFSLGTSAIVNGSGTVHYYVALRDDGSGDLVCGTYTGDGVNGRTLSLPFTPALLMIKRGAGGTTGAAVFRVTPHTGDVTAFLLAAANVANYIEALGTNSATLGDAQQVNANGSVYHYIAIRAGTPDFYVGSYVGDNTDDRNITVGAPPLFVTVKRQSASAAVLRTDDFADDSSATYAAAVAANLIQRFTTDGFQVGNSAETNGSNVNTYTWFAFTEPAAGIARLTEGKLNEGTLVGKGLVN